MGPQINLPIRVCLKCRDDCLVNSRNRITPILHILTGHDLQHLRVIQITNDQIDFVILAKFLLHRLNPVVARYTPAELGAEIEPGIFQQADCQC